VGGGAAVGVGVAVSQNTHFSPTQPPTSHTHTHTILPTLFRLHVIFIIRAHVLMHVPRGVCVICPANAHPSTLPPTSTHHPPLCRPLPPTCNAERQKTSKTKSENNTKQGEKKMMSVEKTSKTNETKRKKRKNEPNKCARVCVRVCVCVCASVRV